MCSMYRDSCAPYGLVLSSCLGFSLCGLVGFIDRSSTWLGNRGDVLCSVNSAEGVYVVRVFRVLTHCWLDVVR